MRVAAGAVCKKDAPTCVALIDELMPRLGCDDIITGLLTEGGKDPTQSASCLRLFGASVAPPGCLRVNLVSADPKTRFDA